MARAALQVQATGKNTRMGQSVQFIYTKTEEGVHAWDLPDVFNPALLDVSRYEELLFRPVHEVLQPVGIPVNVLRDWMLSKASYIIPAGWLDSIQHQKSQLPLFINLNTR